MNRRILLEGLAIVVVGCVLLGFLGLFDGRNLVWPDGLVSMTFLAVVWVLLTSYRRRHEQR